MFRMIVAAIVAHYLIVWHVDLEKMRVLWHAEEIEWLPIVFVLYCTPLIFMYLIAFAFGFRFEKLALRVPAYAAIWSLWAILDFGYWYVIAPSFMDRSDVISISAQRGLRFGLTGFVIATLLDCVRLVLGRRRRP